MLCLCVFLLACHQTSRKATSSHESHSASQDPSELRCDDTPSQTWETSAWLIAIDRWGWSFWSTRETDASLTYFDGVPRPSRVLQVEASWQETGPTHVVVATDSDPVTQIRAEAADLDEGVARGSGLITTTRSGEPYADAHQQATSTQDVMIIRGNGQHYFERLKTLARCVKRARAEARRQ